MNRKIYSKIIGSGSYLPTIKVTNQDFSNNVFYDEDGIQLAKTNQEIIRQLEVITGIRERRYVADDLVASDIAYFAAKDALESSKVDRETLDYIIVSHNFGDVRKETGRSDLVPALSSRVKQKLSVKSPHIIAYDLPFGCAGWLQGVIQADNFIRVGIAKRVLVIGAETLSRVCDPHDRDSMIYADGAGAIILEAVESLLPTGILAHNVQSYTNELAYALRMDKSSNPNYPSDRLFLKMQGRKLYANVLNIVPAVIKQCIEKADVSITDIDKILIHQANNKMDEAILKQLYNLYNIKEVPDQIMPMTISWLGNSSVATVPTLYDLIAKGKIDNHILKAGAVIIFAAVGAGVNINAMVYRIQDEI